MKRKYAKLKIRPFSPDVPDDRLVKEMTFEFDYLPSELEYPETTANYESNTYWYGVGEVYVYTGTSLGDMSLTTYLFAKDESEVDNLIKTMTKLRRLTLPLQLQGGALFPPPRFWVILIPDAFPDGVTTYGLDRIDALLTRIESVGMRVSAAFPDMRPRLVEVNFSFREVVYPYRAYTFSET